MVNSVSQLLVLRLLLGAGESICAPAAALDPLELPRGTKGLSDRNLYGGNQNRSRNRRPHRRISNYSLLVAHHVCHLRPRRSGVASRLAFLANDEPASEAPAFNENTATPDFAGLLASRVTWGILLGTFSYGYFLYFCVTWLPAYLVEYRHLSFDSMGYYALFSFGGMAVCAILSGWLADRMIRRGMDPARTRKGFTILGFVLASTEVFGALSSSQTVACSLQCSRLEGLVSRPQITGLSRKHYSRSRHGPDCGNPKLRIQPGRSRSSDCDWMA